MGSGYAPHRDQGQQYLPYEMRGIQVTKMRMLSPKLLVVSASQARTSSTKLGVLGFTLAWPPDGRSEQEILPLC